ncbi:hypothetical protein J0K78_06320 [Halobacillus sp. GSS1]|uniref:hypothetical protein n=1 Tax=Halobacillus sp. GSS1 TaxID=2815919 RepID=UPI001A8C0726|nr:hypothetical protein [Halobacillus sp. GSS1]MBN9653875.1 hypothetical protein [Halobacillus sp. GSS1]
MNIFSRDRGHVEDSAGDSRDGVVHVQILVNRVNRNERELTVKVLERGREEFVFETSFLTSQSEMYTYHLARDIVKQYVEAEDLIIESEYTDAKLPTVKTVDKRMR